MELKLVKDTLGDAAAEEFAEEYHTLTNMTADPLYMPTTDKEHWWCFCGTENDITEMSCAGCGIKIQTIYDVLQHKHPGDLLKTAVTGDPSDSEEESQDLSEAEITDDADIADFAAVETDKLPEEIKAEMEEFEEFVTDKSVELVDFPDFEEPVEEPETESETDSSDEFMMDIPEFEDLVEEPIEEPETEPETDSSDEFMMDIPEFEDLSEEPVAEPEPETSSSELMMDIPEFEELSEELEPEPMPEPEPTPIPEPVATVEPEPAPIPEPVATVEPEPEPVSTPAPEPTPAPAKPAEPSPASDEFSEPWLPPSLTPEEYKEEIRRELRAEGEKRSRIWRNIAIIVACVVVVFTCAFFVLQFISEKNERADRIAEVEASITKLTENDIPTQEDFDKALNDYNSLPYDLRSEVKYSALLEKYKGIDLKKVKDISDRIDRLSEHTTEEEIKELYAEYKKLTVAEQRFLDVNRLESYSAHLS